jgi:hypothetical protein
VVLTVRWGEGAKLPRSRDQATTTSVYISRANGSRDYEISEEFTRNALVKDQFQL